MPETQRGVHVLKVGNQLYEGWTDIEYARSLDIMASAFEIETTERWPGQPERWPIQTGFAIQILVDGALRLTGWVDEVEPKIDAVDHTIKVRGRGRTGDLIDCSAMNSPGHWTGRRAEQIISDLCKPFGISVKATADTGLPFASFALQQGEAVKDAIDRICQQRGLLPIETPSGDLELARPSQARAGGQLKIGLNGWGEARHDARARFSDYVVKGQRKGSDTDNGAAVAQVTGSAKDAGVTRYRPLMIMAEDQADGLSAATRARFASTVRAGRSQTGKISVVGDRDSSGAPWAHNTLVPVDAPDLGLQGDLLISEVRTKVSQDGLISTLSVIRPEAYSLGEVKGAGLSRLDNRRAGRGAKARKGKAAAPGAAALGGLEQ